MNKDEYEEDLQRRQQEHLKVVAKSSWEPCDHDSCVECIGTGLKCDGTACVHIMECSCPKCKPRVVYVLPMAERSQ